MVDRLPETISGPGSVSLRRWVRQDAELVARAVAENVEHLRPWMPWIAHEPLSLAARRALIDDWEHAWLAGGEVLMGVFSDGSIAGGCGLHRRIGPGGLEIGYWTHVSFLRRGIATTAARLLIDAAFGSPEITHVEIHHDQANHASGGIPRALGFELLRCTPDTAQAPGELGISCEWRLTREAWHRPDTRPSRQARSSPGGF